MHLYANEWSLVSFLLRGEGKVWSVAPLPPGAASTVTILQSVCVFCANCYGGPCQAFRRTHTLHLYLAREQWEAAAHDVLPSSDFKISLVYRCIIYMNARLSLLPCALVLYHHPPASCFWTLCGTGWCK